MGAVRGSLARLSRGALCLGCWGWCLRSNTGVHTVWGSGAMFVRHFETRRRIWKGEVGGSEAEARG